MMFWWCKDDETIVTRLTIPSIFVVPDVDDLPAKTFNNDDLPAPLGPIIAQTVPAATWNKQDAIVQLTIDQFKNHLIIPFPSTQLKSSYFPHCNLHLSMSYLLQSFWSWRHLLIVQLALWITHRSHFSLFAPQLQLFYYLSLTFNKLPK